MKKIIALGIAVVMLLFGFVATAEINVAETGITVCEDLEPKPNPHDGPFLQKICL